METKNLDLTGMHMVQQSYNVEKIINKSVGNDKQQQIKGELYKGKGIDPDKVKAYLTVALAAVATIGTITLGVAGIHHLDRRSDEITAFNMAVRSEAEEKMSDTDALLFKPDLTNKEILARVDQAIEELNADDYKKITGSRVDGTHNTDFDLDNGEVLNLRDIEKDAIDNAAEDYVEDHIRSHR